MGVRIIGKVIRANRHGFFVKQSRWQSTLSQRLTITASPKASKSQVLEELGRHALKSSGQALHGIDDKGVAILASKEFTGWLDDESFMSTFLEALLKPENTIQTDNHGLHVLSGITDGLGPTKLSCEPHMGFSILQGSANEILPGLWGDDGFSNASQDSVSAVSFQTNPLARNTGVLKVTLPLANTVFQNGRRSTLYASRWDVGSQGSLVQNMRNAKITQQIIATGGSINHMSSVLPLLPLTPPRKIIASLGNIIRQVEVDGSPSPASKELEAIIPQIFEKRAQKNPESTPRPVGVWCWVIPHSVVDAIDFGKLKTFSAFSSESEEDIVSSSMGLFSDLLSSGCRLHKILSGGGGWGLKQGLLSLDPETSFSLPGRDDDIEMFIRSFEERNDSEQSGGIATKGSSLLFCMEPQMPYTGEGSIPLPALTRHAFTFGVAPNAEYSSSGNAYSGPVEIIEGHFGASSAAGLYLGAASRAIIGDNSKGGSVAQDTFNTRIDVPNTYIYI
ncbi:hypothetical protein GGS20DRAFT_530464 [Poronia punctata]|nr:hypothetical protein GGS20DRAFT_530464 [Poronia punctata]